MTRRLHLAVLGALALVGGTAATPAPGGIPAEPPVVTRIISSGADPVIEIRAGGGDVEVMPGGNDNVVLVSNPEAAVTSQRGGRGQAFYLTTERPVEGHIVRIGRVVVLPPMRRDQTLVRIAVNAGDIRLRIPARTAVLVVNDTSGAVTIKGFRGRAIVRSFGALTVRSSRLSGESYLQVGGACDLADVDGDDLSVGVFGGPARARHVRARTLEVASRGAFVDWELTANRGDTQSFAIEAGELLLRVPAAAHARIVANSTAGSLGGILQVSAAPFGMDISASGTFGGGGANVAITAEDSSVNVVRGKS
ncbi:MAG TPA: hypothetical protein VNJ51_10990 [Candidatus Dormibacteraeota bacterium]|nr:hypothetical protein [Candidatus Dormibacteraeota bacterium]